MSGPAPSTAKAIPARSTRATWCSRSSIRKVEDLAGRFSSCKSYKQTILTKRAEFQEANGGGWVPGFQCAHYPDGWAITGSKGEILDFDCRDSDLLIAAPSSLLPGSLASQCGRSTTVCYNHQRVDGVTFIEGATGPAHVEGSAPRLSGALEDADRTPPSSTSGSRRRPSISTAVAMTARSLQRPDLQQLRVGGRHSAT